SSVDESYASMQHRIPRLRARSQRTRMNRRIKSIRGGERYSPPQISMPIPSGLGRPVQRSAEGFADRLAARVVVVADIVPGLLLDRGQGPLTRRRAGAAGQLVVVLHRRRMLVLRVL